MHPEIVRVWSGKLELFKPGLQGCQGRISDIHQVMVPRLSSVLAKNNEIMSMFVLFSRFFGHFESLAFFSKMRRQTSHQSSQTGYF